MELEVVQYRMQLIQSDLELASRIRFGSGHHKAPLEDELRALETQLGKTLSAKQVAEDKLNILTGKSRTGSSASDNRRSSHDRC